MGEAKGGECVRMSAHPDAPEPSRVPPLNEITGELRCLNCGRYIILNLWGVCMGKNIERERAFRAKHKNCQPNTLYAE